MKVVSKPIDELKPYWRNPRRGDRAVAVVAESIKRYGFNTPIVVDGAMVVIAGHSRLRAARQLGLTEVPVVVRDDLPPEKVKAYRIADNATAAIARWDYDALAKELMDIDDLAAMGAFFRDGEIAGLLSREDADKAILAAAEAPAEETEGPEESPGITLTCPHCANEFQYVRSDD